MLDHQMILASGGAAESSAGGVASFSRWKGGGAQTAIGAAPGARHGIGPSCSLEVQKGRWSLPRTYRKTRCTDSSPYFLSSGILPTYSVRNSAICCSAASAAKAWLAKTSPGQVTGSIRAARLT